MELQEYMNNETVTAIIELTATNRENQKAKALVIYNKNDFWFKATNATTLDVLSFFASGLMATLKKDSSVMLIESASFVKENGAFKKSIGFAPVARFGDEFKQCLIGANGEIEIL